MARPSAPLRLERLAAHHPLAAFTCGDAAIDDFLHHHALAEQQAGLSSVMVVLDPAEGDAVVGYYSLSPLSIRLDAGLLQAVGLGAVPYPMVGGYLLGRFGVATTRAGQGIGEALVAVALEAAAHARVETGGVFLAVDPKDERVVAWYERLGFTRLDSGRRRVVRRLEVNPESVG